MRLLLILLLFAGALSAQTIDKDRSRFLTTPNGRTGSYAPYRLVVDGLGGVETLKVRSCSPGVTLTREVAVGGVDRVDIVLPVLVAEGSYVVASVPGADNEAPFQPKLPTRRIEPDYERPYIAVFSTDPLYARGVLPSVPGTSVCDYFELGEFFTDWRLLDGYDAIVIFNPTDVRLPSGSQRAIAEFCSLGGTAVVAGSFALGEQSVGLPAPGELQVKTFRDVQARRFGYGAGAIYRFGADDLRRSRSAQLVLLDAVLDQAWYGAAKAPAREPETRLAPQHPPLAPPLPPADATPTPWFWAMAGALLLVCGLVPGVASRYLKRTWPVQLGLLALCSGLGGLAMLQARPLPTVELCVLMHTGEGEVASGRVFVNAEESWRNTLFVNLDDAEDRSLPRTLPSSPGWNSWLIDMPLMNPPAGRADAVTLRYGMIGDDSFRDFGTKAHRGQTKFSTDDAFLVDWWLETNAWRGRSAELMPVEWPDGAVRFDDARVVTRGAISVTALREAG
ncbi:MAG: hypothetical protein KDB82_05620 [Planctomycetes bacterium]|nr:hypothetical protein [Planctomycetota bacterium]